MNIVKTALNLTLVLGAALPMVQPFAQASEFNQKTTIKFGVPVEMPGHVLEPGTYVFKLLDSPSNRNIVQVTNERENQVYGTFLSVPAYRMHPSSKTVLAFDERPGKSPMALTKWF
jgi:hypothetical protein